MGTWSQPKTERNEEWVRLHTEEGLTLSEIGERYDVTRERVRQVVRKLGVPQWVTQEVRRVASMVPRVDWECEFCGKRERRTENNAQYKSCGDSACVSAAHRDRTDEEMLEALRNLAYRLGRVPGKNDVNADPDTPSQSNYQTRFGGLSAAQEAAGLPPTGPGKSPARIVPVEDRESEQSGAEHGSSPATDI